MMDIYMCIVVVIVIIIISSSRLVLWLIWYLRDVRVRRQRRADALVHPPRADRHLCVDHPYIDQARVR